MFKKLLVRTAITLFIAQGLEVPIIATQTLKNPGKTCSICLEALKRHSTDFGQKNQVIMLASCKHTFHTRCLAEWMNIAATCPNCRHAIIFEDRLELKARSYYAWSIEDINNPKLPESIREAERAFRNYVVQLLLTHNILC